jgi:2,3-bisphosphoglycerate-independent phosphoglycerate mutase
MNKKVILIILDGWGITQDPKVSAIEQAHTPFIDNLLQKYPNAQLRTDGLHVGLPEGQMGNSEVGHMNLGAGRIVYQNLVKINKAVLDKTLDQEKVLQNAFDYAKKNNTNVHFIGLVSDGGIHSHINHLKGLLRAAKNANITNTYIHALTDGRDTDPKSGVSFIKELDEYTKQTTGKIASVIGRYYAMDRDKRWERIKLAYDLLVHGKGKKTKDIIKAIKECYENGITDEFIKPIIKVDDNNQPIATIKPNDVVIYFNFRTDRGRELTEALTQRDFKEYGMKKLPLYFITMVEYNNDFKGIKVIYPVDNLKNTIGEVLAKNNKKQIRIAETEKYPHVTFFFSGGREELFDGEKRILKPSPKVATYDLKPEMSAKDIRDAIIPEIEKKETDLIVLNFANTDMVGHTGVFDAAVKAAETVDLYLKDIVKKAIENDYVSIIIADHGNSEKMINEDGTPNTAHTINPVPIIIVDKDIKTVKDGVLANIAPTILDILEIEKPKEMEKESLIEKK